MNAEPLISVIIPCYNSERTLERTLRSVLEQGRKDLETIIVDDGSRDSTPSLARDISARYPELNARVVTQSNQGVSAARNKGIRESRGRYIALLDSDDAWVPGKLARQVEILESQPDVGIVGGLYTAPEVARVPRRIRERPEGWILGTRDFLARNYLQPSTVLVRRSLIDEIKAFDSTLTHAEEGEFFLRAAAATKVLLLGSQFVVYGHGESDIVRADSLSSNLWKMERGELTNLNIALGRGHIGTVHFLALYLFSIAKFLRRLILRFLSQKLVHRLK